MNYADKERKIKQIIDDLKGLCSQNGLSNTANEEVVITNVFLYKFLNDKFMANLKAFAREIGMSVEDVLENDDAFTAFYDSNEADVAFGQKDTIEYLINLTTQEKFGDKVDDALDRISNNPRNEKFKLETADGVKKPLFEHICDKVEPSAKDNFAKAIFGIIGQEKFDFGDVANGSFDFYSTIFEYLIKDYNVASGKYAEYFTPQSVSSIIAKILVGSTEKIEAAEICDCAAGSGSLILHLAHELGQENGMNRALVYTQDISAKSSRFLRLNLMLNGMMESLGNVVQGDTLLNPSHFAIEGDPTSGLKKWDYQTINPPFKMDFSSTRDQIEAKWHDTDRFFAGVPKIPNAKKESMSIYLMFIQQVLYTMKPNGKAAIVVPTGFLTAQSGIEATLRRIMIEEKMLKGVISMPSNIFANTGTNVSVMFLDKGNKDDSAILIDASKLGHDEKVGKNKKRVLDSEEMHRIIDTFLKKEEVEDFSVVVSFDDFKDKNWSFSAGQYFEVKIEHVDITPDEFRKKMCGYQEKLANLFKEGDTLQSLIKATMENLTYDEN